MEPGCAVFSMEIRLREDGAGYLEVWREGGDPFSPVAQLDWHPDRLSRNPLATLADALREAATWMENHA